MLDKEISNLIAYAETHLLLDELDAAQATRRILSTLKLDSFTPEEADAEEIDQSVSPDKFLDPLLKYAEENKVGDKIGRAHV